MLRKANNVFSVILDDAAQAFAALPTAGTTVTDVNLAKGAIVVADLGNNRLNAAAFAALPASGQFRILQGLGAGLPLMKSPILTKAKVMASVASHVEARQQITTIGYNGTTGALPTANDTNFFIKIRKRDNDAANRSQPFSLFAGPVRTDLTGTQEELAYLLVRNGLLNFKDEPARHYLKFEAVSDAPVGAAITGDVVYGVRNITNLSAPVLVGETLVITDATTGLDATYVVESVVSATEAVLNYAYQGTTETGAAVNQTTSGTNYGVRLTGIQAIFDVNKWRDYYANRFTATFSDSSTLVTHRQGAFNGTGMWQQVAMDEYLSYGYEGENNQLAVPSTPRTQEVKIPGYTTGATALTAKYSTLNLFWEESISGLVSMDGGKGSVIVHLNLRDSAGTGILVGSASTGEELANVLGPVYGFVAADFNE
jgi:hypothetical protein